MKTIGWGKQEWGDFKKERNGNQPFQFEFMGRK